MKHQNNIVQPPGRDCGMPVTRLRRAEREVRSGGRAGAGLAGATGTLPRMGGQG